MQRTYYIMKETLPFDRHGCRVPIFIHLYFVERTPFCGRFIFDVGEVLTFALTDVRPRKQVEAGWRCYPTQLEDFMGKENVSVGSRRADTGIRMVRGEGIYFCKEEHPEEVLFVVNFDGILGNSLISCIYVFPPRSLPPNPPFLSLTRPLTHPYPPCPSPSRLPYFPAPFAVST